MGARGPGLKTLTDLVQEGCNRRNGRNGPPTPGLEDYRAEAILTSVETPRLNPPGGSMVTEAILTFKNEGKCSIWASSLQNFACGACNGQKTVCFCFLFGGDQALRGWGRAPT